MIIFYCVLALGLGGIGYVLWNLKNETEYQSLPVEKIDPDQIGSFGLQENLNPGKKFKLPGAKSSKPPLKTNFLFSSLSTPFQKVFNKIKPPPADNKQAFNLKTKETFLLKDKFSQNPFNVPNQKQTPVHSINAAPTTNAVPTTNPAPTTSPQPMVKPLSPKQLNNEEIRKIEVEIDLSTELNELKTRHERLEKIFQERNSEFEKNQEELNNELKNRKEFNKIKDLLEKELKDAKNQSRDSQTKLNLVMAEMEGHKKRNTVLEEKVTRLEKDILKKEEEIDTLVKRLQTFASPTTSITPPKRDLPGETTPPTETVISEPPASTEEVPFLKLNPDVTKNHEPPKEQT